MNLERAFLGLYLSRSSYRKAGWLVLITLNSSDPALTLALTLWWCKYLYSWVIEIIPNWISIICLQIADGDEHPPSHIIIESAIQFCLRYQSRWPTGFTCNCHGMTFEVTDVI